MRPEDEYFLTLSKDKIWQRYCGFLDLSMEEFMDIQKELLMDEIDRVSDSVLAKKIMGNHKPRSVEDFRQTVPLTNYDDYQHYFDEHREDVLAVKPQFWCHSSGRGGYFKWFPQSSEYFEKGVRKCIASFILASAREKGEVNIYPGFKLLSVVAPIPYGSGYTYKTLQEYMTIRIMPDPKSAESLSFEDRFKMGFQIALKDGVDIIGAIASVLVRMGEIVGGEARGMQLSWSMLHPKVINRLLKAGLSSKREKRGILPRDLWPTKAIMTSGMDTAIYKDTLARYWGVEPYELYGCTEALFIALQSWHRKGMVFVPDTVFFEFIPYNERGEPQHNSTGQPATVLLDELEVGKIYEVVVTQSCGMPLLRYRMKDLIKVIGLKDEEAGINLPHVAFQRRADEVINLAGLAQLDEKTIWQAIGNTGLKCTDWTAQKSYDESKSFLQLCLELREKKDPVEVATAIDDQLKIVDTDYKDIESYLNLQPVRVTLLSPGTFQRYVQEKMKEGADLGHLKPLRINPSEGDISRLLKLSESVRQE